MERVHRNLYYPDSAFVFAALAAAAVVAFWRNYLAILPRASAYAHVHGIAMFLWVSLLVVQASLIRTDARSTHRRLGTASYVLVPIIVLSTLIFAHERLSIRGIERGVSLLYIQLSGLFLFAVSCALAIYRRKSPVLHTRYIICSALALVDPIFFRIFNRYVLPPSIRPEWLSPSALTYSMTTLLFLWLISRNPQMERKIGVYPWMLLLFLVLQIPTFFIADTRMWHAFAVGFLSLPLP